MKRLLFGLGIMLLLIGGWQFGPKKTFPPLDNTLLDGQLSLPDLDALIRTREDTFPLKPNNEARIVWADSIRKTPYSIIFLHGFSGSPMECDPIHLKFARQFGCNLYLARYPEHGIDHEDALLHITPQSMLDAAKEALWVGEQIGEKVIILSVSTGGTLSIYLSALYPEKVAAQILLSPNIRLYSDLAYVLTQPWGLQIGRMIEGERRYLDHLKGETRNYWSTTYRLESVVALLDLMEQTMKPEIFEKVVSPVFVGYYYKNEAEQDKVVSVEAIKSFYEQISTPASLKAIEAFPNAGHHVVCSRFQSKDFETVLESMSNFTISKLGLQPVSPVTTMDATPIAQ